jgi:hypothetical protein
MSSRTARAPAAEPPEPAGSRDSHWRAQRPVRRESPRAAPGSSGGSLCLDALRSKRGCSQPGAPAPSRLSSCSVDPNRGLSRPTHGRIRPWTSGSASSRVPPTSVATSGLSMAIASSTTFGVPSYSDDWTTMSWNHPARRVRWPARTTGASALAMLYTRVNRMVRA